MSHAARAHAATTSALWQPRLLRPGEEEALLDLFVAAYGRWPRFPNKIDPLAHLCWKLEAGDPSCRAAVIEHEGRFVGGYLLPFREATVRDERVRAAAGSDVAVRPSHQGRGVFSALARFTFELHSRVADLLYGYESRNRGVARTLERLPRGLIENAPVRFVLSDGPAPIGRPSEGVIRNADMFDERADQLAARGSEAFDFVLDRGAAFLNWRYCDIRAGHFETRVAEESGNMTGYVVFTGSRGTGRIADLLAVPERPDVVQALVTNAVGAMQAPGARRIECWLPPQHPYADALAEIGFSQRSGAPRFTYVPFRTPTAELALLADGNARIHLTLGDTDLV
jgi:GNAT superfamily N-acetyltransferase